MLQLWCQGTLGVCLPGTYSRGACGSPTMAAAQRAWKQRAKGFIKRQQERAHCHSLPSSSSSIPHHPWCPVRPIAAPTVSPWNPSGTTSSSEPKLSAA
ncbi:hypothetical protein VTG60DRAFT_1842 [Thermothelomyces hinnuleus]